MDKAEKLEQMQAEIGGMLERLRTELGSHGKVSSENVAVICMTALTDFIEHQIVHAMAASDPARIAKIIVGSSIGQELFRGQIEAVTLDILMHFAQRHPDVADRLCDRLYAGSDASTNALWIAKRDALADSLVEDAEIMIGMLEIFDKHNDIVDAVSEAEKITGDARE